MPLPFLCFSWLIFSVPAAVPGMRQCATVDISFHLELEARSGAGLQPYGNARPADIDRSSANRCALKSMLAISPSLNDHGPCFDGVNIDQSQSRGVRTQILDERADVVGETGSSLDRIEITKPAVQHPDPAVRKITPE